MTTVVDDTQSRESIAATNTRVWQDALPALAALSAQEIPVMVLKSLPQIEELYGDAGGRLTLDVDLFVHAGDVERAFAALETAGYRPKTGKEYADLAAMTRVRGRARALRERKWTLLPGPDSAGFDLDLHNDGIDRWRSTALPPTVWERARPVERDGIHYLLPAPEDRLIYLCWTIADESFRPRKTADLAQILAHPEALDWSEIDRRSRALGLALAVQVVCNLTAVWHDLPLTPRITLSRRQRMRAALFQAIILRRVHLSRPEAMAARILIHDRPLTTWLPALRQAIERHPLTRVAKVLSGG